jgi:hypothetical protein
VPELPAVTASPPVPELPLLSEPSVAPTPPAPAASAMPASPLDVAPLRPFPGPVPPASCEPAPPAPAADRASSLLLAPQPSCDRAAHTTNTEPSHRMTPIVTRKNLPACLVSVPRHHFPTRAPHVGKLVRRVLERGEWTRCSGWIELVCVASASSIGL